MRKFLFASFAFSISFLALATHPAAAALNPGELIRGSQPAVYYFAQDGKRYVFPNEKTYATWYSGFGSVNTITDMELAALPMGGNVTYRPGVKLIKVTTDPRTYAVSAGGTLRWIQAEATARELYGTNWNTKVDDVADTYFINYKIGSPITSSEQYSATNELALATTISSDKNLEQTSNVNKRAVVIIYKNIYDALKPDITNFQNDVFANLGVRIDILQLQDSVSYTPLDIRNLLIKECQLDGVNGCSNLGGAVLVGDIPYALYEQPYDSNHLAPFMYFYEDLDASFKQNNLGHYYGYDSYGAHEGPEIYTGWIPSTFPASDFNNYSNELRAYFQKHHNFFTKQSVPAKWAVSAVHVPYPAGYNHYMSIPTLGLTVYGTTNSIDIMPDVADNLAPFKPALLAELAKGPEVAYLHSHGDPTVVWGLTASDIYGLSNLPLFTLTWGCANGSFIDVVNKKDSIVLAFIHGKNLGLSILSKLDSNDIDVHSGNCPDCGWFEGQYNFFHYLNKGQYVGEAWLNVEHDFAAYFPPTPAPAFTSTGQLLLPAPNSSTSNSSSVQPLNLYKLSGPLQRIIIGSPFIYSPTARK